MEGISTVPVRGRSADLRAMARVTKNHLTLTGWALYDFANTIFSAVVLTFYFPLYLTAVTGRNLHLGVTTTVSMILAGAVVPWLGALSDRTGKTKSYLVTSTLICITFMGALSFVFHTGALVLIFLLACVAFHASLVFYFALLPVVAPPEKQGWASGVGTGVGYLGVLVSVPIAYLVDYYLGRRFVFVAAAGLFLLFALPLYFWVPERKVPRPVKPTRELFITEWLKVFGTLARLPKNRPLFFFFLGNFFFMEAMNTVIFWMIVYLSRVFRPSELELVGIFLGLNFSASLFGFVAGKMTERWGSGKTVLLAALSLLVTVTALGLSRHFFLFAALALSGGAFSFAGIWTAARKRVVEMAPAESVGEYFGIYNLTTKISVVGSLVFSILADRFGFQTALLSQAVPSALGLYFFWRSRRP